MTTINMTGKQVCFYQYYGTISARVYDPETQKNVAKIELPHLKEYLENKLKAGFYIKQEGKGRALTTIELI